MAAPTPRGRARRERLVEAAATLVAERGYHQVGVDEIGAAAGVSGAAIYRHFSGKQDILVTVIERAVAALIGEARRIVAEASSPHRALQALVDAHVRFALTETALITVYDQEAHNLADGARRRLRRQQRAYTELWIDVLVPLAPGTPRDEIRVAVQGVFGLVNSVADHHVGLPPARSAPLLASMATAALDPVLEGGPLGM